MSVLPEELAIVKTYSEIAEQISKTAERGVPASPSLIYNPRTSSIEYSREGMTLRINARELRMKCKCALCVEEMTGVNKIVASSIPGDVHPINIQKKGNYAVAVVWSDGHNSSLYPYARLESEFNG